MNACETAFNVSSGKLSIGNVEIPNASYNTIYMYMYMYMCSFVNLAQLDATHCACIVAARNAAVIYNCYDNNHHFVIAKNV